MPPIHAKERQVFKPVRAGQLLSLAPTDAPAMSKRGVM
jgi:hypothetical protein